MVAGAAAVRRSEPRNYHMFVFGFHIRLLLILKKFS